MEQSRGAEGPTRTPVTMKAHSAGGIESVGNIKLTVVGNVDGVCSNSGEIFIEIVTVIGADPGPRTPLRIRAQAVDIAD